MALFLFKRKKADPMADVGEIFDSEPHLYKKGDFVLGAYSITATRSTRLPLEPKTEEQESVSVWALFCTSPDSDQPIGVADYKKAVAHLAKLYPDLTDENSVVVPTPSKEFLADLSKQFPR